MMNGTWVSIGVGFKYSIRLLIESWLYRERIMEVVSYHVSSEVFEKCIL